MPCMIYTRYFLTKQRNFTDSEKKYTNSSTIFLKKSCKIIFLCYVYINNVIDDNV